MKTFNFTKTMVALSLAGLMSSVAMADEIDSEIAKLKKENELLELKKKNAQLQKSGVSFSNVVESDGEDYTDKLTGFFVGAELGISPSVYNSLNVSGASANNASIHINLDNTTYALPLNLGFGYQWYPWANAGFKFRGYLGYASYNESVSGTTSQNGQMLNMQGTFSSQAIHYGLEAEYLYDFIVGQTHTFGVSLGVGYEFGTFIGQELNATISESQGATKMHVQPFDSYTSSGFSSSFGVHYYYNINHQFELKYRYNSGYTTQQDMTLSYGEGSSETYSYYTAPFGSLLFAYNYKF